MKKIYIDYLLFTSDHLRVKFGKKPQKIVQNLSQRLTVCWPKVSLIDKTSGFTLIELLLYMGIFVILLVVFIQMFGSLIETQLESESTSSVTEDQKYILDRLSYDIHRASSITTPALGSTGSSLQVIIDGSTYTYALSGGALQITNSNGTDQLNSAGTTVSNVSFTNIGAGGSKPNVQIKFVLTSVATPNSGAQKESVQTTVSLR